jgi:hypothetical protein
MPEAAGEPCDLPALFDRYKERLRRTVRLQLDPRLTGIVDSSGVLRMAREEVDRRVAEAAGRTAASFLGLRQIVGEVLAWLALHALHPGADGCAFRPTTSANATSLELDE